jgi:hypothetical protein
VFVNLFRPSEKGTKKKEKMALSSCYLMQKYKKNKKGKREIK